jgi:hypothetical protein
MSDKGDFYSNFFGENDEYKKWVNEFKKLDRKARKESKKQSEARSAANAARLMKHGNRRYNLSDSMDWADTLQEMLIAERKAMKKGKKKKFKKLRDERHNLERAIKETGQMYEIEGLRKWKYKERRRND